MFQEYERREQQRKVSILCILCVPLVAGHLTCGTNRVPPVVVFSVHSALREGPGETAHLNIYLERLVS